MQLLNRFANHIVTLGMVIFLCFLPYTLYAQDEIWNFDNAEIGTVIKKVSEKTGKNFILDPRVQGKVTLISQNPVNEKEAYQVLLSLLRVHGFKVVESNNVIRIVPQDSANNDKGPVINKATENGEQEIIKIITLKYISPNEILPSLREIIPRTGHVMAIEASNHIIVADTQNNILKVEKLIKQIDTKTPRMVNMVSLQYASATEVATSLGNLLRDKGGSRAFPISLGADERTNSLLISGGTKELRDYIMRVAKQFDTPTDNHYNSEVIYLKYIAASTIAPIIASFLEESLRTNKEHIEEANNKASAASFSAPTQVVNNAPMAPPNHLRALQEFNYTQGEQGSLFAENDRKPQSGIVSRFVQWEESSNALIIKAPTNIMRAIKSIIAKLDIRRPQVIIEVIIAELSLNRIEEYGVEWDVSSDASIKVGTRFNPPLHNTIVGGLTGGAVNLLGQGLSVGVFRHGDLSALIRMLASDTSANILSTPTLVTLDNQTALIKVGEKVPFAIGQTNNQNSGGNPFTSYDREEVGLSLTIKPQIVNDCEIKLQIENILSNVVPNSANISTGGNPTTSERTIITNVIVEEGKILVLGGLIQDTWQEMKAQVPFFGSIPFIGYLFKSEKKELVKKNLMIFLRPRIIENDTLGIQISTNKYDEMRKAQVQNYGALNHPFVDEPITAQPLHPNDYYKEPVAPTLQIAEVILPMPFQ